MAHAFRWEYSHKGLKLVQLLGQFGVFPTHAQCVTLCEKRPRVVHRAGWPAKSNNPRVLQELLNMIGGRRLCSWNALESFPWELCFRDTRCWNTRIIRSSNHAAAHQSAPALAPRPIAPPLPPCGEVTAVLSARRLT
jgi:hypothetical protein